MAQPWISGCQESHGASVGALSDAVLTLTIENTTVEGAFVQLLTAAKLPGGVVLRLGRSATPYTFNLHEMRVKEALDYLVGYDGKYAWAVDHGAVYLYPKDGAPKFLQTRIEAFKGGPASVGGLLALLVDLPEIKVARSNLRLRSARFMGGLHNPQPRLVSVELRDVTFTEALNIIAAKHGSAIWQYGEDSQTGEYNLLFIKR